MLSNCRISEDFFQEWKGRGGDTKRKLGGDRDSSSAVKSLQLELERNRILEIQVSHLQELVGELRCELEQYHNEAIGRDAEIANLVEQLSSPLVNSESEKKGEEIEKKSLGISSLECESLSSSTHFYGELTEQSAFVAVENHMLRSLDDCVTDRLGGNPGVTELQEDNIRMRKLVLSSKDCL